MDFQSVFSDPDILNFLSPGQNAMVPAAPLWNSVNLFMQQSLMQQINDPSFSLEKDSAGPVELTPSVVRPSPIHPTLKRKTSEEPMMTCSCHLTETERPTTSESDEKKETETGLKFEMGSLPITTYYPTHFMRGTQLELPNKKLKKVEDLSTDDFLKCAGDTKDVNVGTAFVTNIKLSVGCVTIVFKTGISPQSDNISLKVQREHPFFVLGKGWTSCDPQKTAENYGLQCENLQIGDVCIILTQKTGTLFEENDVTDIVGAEMQFEATNERAHWREQLTQIFEEYCDGRKSAPPERLVSNPLPQRMRKTSECWL